MSTPQLKENPESRDGTAGWEPDLVESVYGLLDTVDTASPALVDGLRSLEARYRDLVYSELIYLLSHLRFAPEEARQHWEQILEHRDRMQGAHGATVDVRVALVSYFVEVNRKLHNPKIIEMKLFERTRANAYRDELTGLHNFRMFREHMEQEILRSGRHGTPLSLVMIDIDNFKDYNDQNGHEAGNVVLTGVAELLAQLLRKTDVAARYGGEEFALVLPATPKTSAGLVAERAREAISAHGFAHERNQPQGQLTVSLGVATYPADAGDAGELVRHADRAMYVAKSNGKNQVQLYAKSRRSFGRVGTSLDGTFRVPALGSFPLTTVNLSEAGVLFSTPREVEPGDLVDLELRLPEVEFPLRASGRVVHIEPEKIGMFRVAVRIAEIADRGRPLLTAYIQRLNRKQATGE